MQNVDFYAGKQNNKPMNQQIYDSGNQNAEFFSRTSTNNKTEERFRKKAIRIIFMISALSIISFTTGLALGIKFAGGTNKEIVDKDTFDAVSKVKNSISSMIKPQISKKSTSVSTRFPKSEFPFVIKVGKEFSKQIAESMAKSLSLKGHTVIISKSGKNFKVYTGPYKSKLQAKASSQKISKYKRFSQDHKIKIIHRT